MPIMRAIRLGLLGSGVAAVLASAATAEVVQMKYDGKGAGQNVKIESGLFSGDVFAGQLKHTITGSSSLDGSWITFCTDLAQTVHGSFASWTVVPVELLPQGMPMGGAKADAIRDLYAFAAGSQLLESTSNAFAAAFQIAIWEVIMDFDPDATDRGLSVASGALKVTKTNGDPLGSGVMGHLASLFGAIGMVDASGVELAGLASAQHQDQLIVIPSPGALALIAVAAMAGRRRR